ncbi:MAG: TonB-dependent receptor, partial [Colwellia sp.]
AYGALCLAVAPTINIHTVQAAETSTVIKGSIKNLNGEAIPGAKIKIIHQPSGSIKTITANDVGVYRARALRVGGPYTIMLSSDNHIRQEYKNVHLKLDDILDLSAKLAEMETITVTNSSNSYANYGANSTFSEQEINQSAIVNRDIKDIVRANPLAVVDPSGIELSIAGSNPRYNALTIDGVGVNDTYGLNANGYPSQRPPIAMNAISQIAIDYAPFNARASGFTGAAINVVTKSGTNEFSGDVFYEWTPSNGEAKDNKLTGTSFDFDNEEQTFGAAFGGAIAKDKLFYFVSYEQWSDEVVFNYDLTTLTGHKVTLDDAKQVLSAFDKVYGLNDSIGSVPPEDSDEKLLVKLDWNINDNHRIDFTYNKQKNIAANGYTNNNSSLKFGSFQYSQDAETTMLTGHLFSDWSDNFSSEINVSYKDHQDIANTNSNWGQIRIKTADGGEIFAGQERNRHANVKDNETTKLAAHGLYLQDFIEYKFGVEIENVWNSDLYARNGAGTWYFSSIDDFENKTPWLVQYGNAYTNNMQDLAAEIDATQYAFYLEANSEIFDGFDLSAGLRYETLSMDSAPNFNEKYANSYGESNTENLDGIDILLPRVSFNWQLSDDLTLRGGLGRFSGGMPLIWISNAYLNDGVTNVSAPQTAVDTTIADPDNVMFDQVPLSLQSSLVPGNGSVSTVASDFEIPSDWRYQLAADVLFDISILGDAGENFAWTTEFIYVDRQDAARWHEQSRVKIAEAVDGRTIWGDLAGREGFRDIQLTNSSDGGQSTIITTALNKTWHSGLSVNVSYTNQDITEANAGTGTHAYSNYYSDIVINRNEPLVGRAYYEIEHRLVVNLAYQHEFFAGYNTAFNLFFERRSGRPFSWVLAGDAAFGGNSSVYSAYLPYLPSGADDAAFDFSQLSYQDTMAIANAAGVGQHAGGYIPKYAGTQPWLTTMDLAISQELPGLLAGHKGQLYFIIDNFANLLKSDWGKSYRMSSSQQELFDVSINNSGQYVLSEKAGGANTKNYNQFDVEQSAWSIKVGVKYSF